MGQSSSTPNAPLPAPVPMPPPRQQPTVDDEERKQNEQRKKHLELQEMEKSAAQWKLFALFMTEVGVPLGKYLYDRFYGPTPAPGPHPRPPQQPRPRIPVPPSPRPAAPPAVRLPPPEPASADTVAGAGDKECVLCMDRSVKTMLRPCGHAQFCLTCARTVAASQQPVCPVCKGTFTEVARIYL